jgi:2-phosphoglycolate phosphatase
MSELQVMPQGEPTRTLETGLGRAVLFDLDGTLADTAPDLAAAVNKMRRSRGLDLVPIDALRPLASAGARGLIGRAFGKTPEDADFPALRDEFLANYAADICIETTLFPGIAEVLNALATRGVPWGIVTNKIQRLTTPLADQLGLTSIAGCIVCGDTTPHSKPHPAPLLHAASLLDIKPDKLIYVGDDMRDIQAGRAAGMMTIAAAYGYCGNDLPALEWQADYVVNSVDELDAMLATIC